MRSARLPTSFSPVPSVTRFSTRTFRALLPVVAVGLAACAQTFDATSLGVPVTMASTAGAPAQGAHFDVHATQLWAVWGLLPVSEPALNRVLAAELVGGKSVADVRIHTHTRLTDMLITAVTFGLLVPRAIEFSGTIVGDNTVPAPPAPAAPKP